MTYREPAKASMFFFWKLGWRTGCQFHPFRSFSVLQGHGSLHVGSFHIDDQTKVDVSWCTHPTTHQRPGNTMQHRIILISIETWKVQTWFVFVCVWRKTPSPFLPRNKFVKRSGPPSFSFRLWSPLAAFPTENPIQPGVIQILRGVQQNKVAYPVPNTCSRGYI